MTRQIPQSFVLWLIAVLSAVALIVGLLSDLGADTSLIVGGAAAGVSAAVVGILSRGRAPTFAEAACVVLVGLVGFLAVERLERDTADKSPVGSERRIFDFYVYAGEEDPDDSSVSFEEPRWAFPRLEPSAEAPTAEDGSIFVGTHVKVECKVETATEGDPDWYKLTDGNFLHSDVVKQSPHSGPPPPECS